MPKYELIEAIDWDKNPLIPAIAQDCTSGQVLMLAYVNEEALMQTLATGYAHYYSRSRKELWKKGATSGNVQKICEVMLDCDSDALLYKVEQTGPACHTGNMSCFYRTIKCNG